VVEEVLLEGGAPLPAVLRGPADAEPAVPTQLADQLAVRRPARLPAGELGPAVGGHQPLEVPAQVLLQRPLLGGQVDVHTTSSLSSLAAARYFRPPGAATRCSFRMEGGPVNDAVIVEAAINGTTTKDRNPHVPRLPDEIARDALACLESGAGV